MKERALPEGWEWRKVGDVIENIPLTGKKLPNSEYDEEGIIPVVDQGQNLIGGYTNRENLKITTDFPLIGFGDHTRILKYINFEFVPGADGIKILKPSKEFDPKFFYYAIKSSNILDLGYSRHFKILKEVIIPLPPLPIQRQIVAFLEQAEAVKRQRQEADALTGTLLQSVFLEIFGEPENNERGWERKTLADVCVKFEHGLYVPKERYVENNGIEMIHMADAFYGKVKPGNLRQISATDKESKKYQLLENDLLIARRSLTFEGAAKACKLPKNFGKLLFESSLIRVRPDETCIDPEYLYQYLNNPTIRRKYVFPFVTSSTISGINQENLKKITVLLPPLALQQQFARVVENVERIREQQVASGIAIEGLFEGLMAGAFTEELTG